MLKQIVLTNNNHIKELSVIQWFQLFTFCLELLKNEQWTLLIQNVKSFHTESEFLDTFFNQVDPNNLLKTSVN